MASEATTTKRCPKCRSRSFAIVETTENTTSWEVRDGTFDMSARDEQFSGFNSVGGNCRRCGHIWTFRKAQQIDDVVQEPRI